MGVSPNQVAISADGVVEAYIGTSSTPTQLGQLQLFRFANKEGLESAGDNNFLETAASGPAQAGTPNTDGMGNVMQGYLEEANVNPVTEIADLIAAQRAYEMNARVISGADEMLSSVSQMRCVSPSATSRATKPRATERAPMTAI